MSSTNSYNLFLYDLPKQSVTSTKIAELIKKETGYEVGRNEQPQIKRELFKPFYNAVVRINETAQAFEQIKEKLTFFELDGMPCRALPFDPSFSGAQRQNLNTKSIFVKIINHNKPKGKKKEDNKLTVQQIREFYQKFSAQGCQIHSFKISIDEEYNSRDYAFITFKDGEHAQRMLNTIIDGYQIAPYNPKDKREIRRIFNNIFIKNFPESWDEEKLRQVFEKYGRIKSLAMKKQKIPGSDIEAAFAFVCYEDPYDKDYGPMCAQSAVNDLHGKVIDGQQIYVSEAKSQKDREIEAQKEALKFKNSKKRCNLFIKNYPPETTQEELLAILLQFGEVENLKMFDKEGGIKFAFVCYKNPEYAMIAKQSTPTINGKQLYINYYEIKEYRMIEQEKIRDNVDWQNYVKQRGGGESVNLDILNKPELMQGISYLMQILQRNQVRGGQMRPYNGPRHPQSRSQFPQGQMPPRPQPTAMPMPRPNQMPGQPPMMNHQMRMPQQTPMGVPMTMVNQMMIPPQQQLIQNIPPHILEYNSNGAQVVPAVNPANPNYKSQVGEFIYEHVERLIGEERAPKITGMLIDLPINDIVGYLTDFTKLEEKIREALTLLTQQ